MKNKLLYWLLALVGLFSVSCKSTSLVQKGVDTGFKYAKQAGVFNPKTYVLKLGESDTLINLNTTFFKTRFRRVAPGVYLLELQLKYEDSREQVKKWVEELGKLLEGKVKDKVGSIHVNPENSNTHMANIVIAAYREITSKLKVGLPATGFEIKHFNLYNSSASIIPATPYIRVKPVQTTWKERLGVRVPSPFSLELIVGTAAYSDAQDGSTTQGAALEVFDLLTAIEKLLHNYSAGNCISSLEVVTTRYDTGYEVKAREDAIVVSVYSDCEGCP